MDMGAVTVVLRVGSGKAGPLVYIYWIFKMDRTDNGNFILDADFGMIKNPRELNDELIKIPGIVETGLFINMVNVCVLGLKNGHVEINKL